MLAASGMLPSYFAGAQTNRATSSQIGHIERATDILGRNISGPQGQTIGKFQDLAADLESGRVLFAVVALQGGGTAIGTSRVAVPPEEFSFGPDQSNLVLNASQTNLDSAPRFNPQAGTRVGSVAFVRDVYRHFGRQPWWVGPSSSATSASTNAFGNAHLASQLRGQKVKTVSNQDLGTVRNLVVDLPAGRVLYVVFKPSGSLGANNTVYVLPPNAFTPGSDPTTLVTGVDEAKLRGAPHFSSTSWPDVANPSYATQVYQYYGKQPYFNPNAQLSPTSDTNR